MNIFFQKVIKRSWIQTEMLLMLSTSGWLKKSHDIVYTPKEVTP